MSRREKEKRASLDTLGKLAYSSPSPPPALPPKPPPAPKARTPPLKPLPPAPAPPLRAEEVRAKQLKERREKLAEEKALRTRRAGELARASNVEWRGMDRMGVPASIRRTGFDRDEPSTAQKIHDILGENREKEGRAKARAKGKRLRG